MGVAITLCAHSVIGNCCPTINMFKLVSFYIAFAVFHSAYGARELMVDGVRTLFGVEGDHLVISCLGDQDASYCGFTHPKGDHFSFVGSSLEHGKCVYALNATKCDEGDWTCHVGTNDTNGKELTEITRVKITDRLTAVWPKFIVNLGDEVTLTCITSQAEQPIDYCRIIPPQGRKPFNLNSLVTRDRALSGRYFFPANKSLERGDCGVTIMRAGFEDSGAWMCSTWIEERGEFIDTITLAVRGDKDIRYNTLILFCVAILFLFFSIGLTVYITLRTRHLPGGVVEEIHEMAPISIPRILSVYEPDDSPPKSRVYTHPRQQTTEPTTGSTESSIDSRETTPSVDRSSRSTPDQPTVSALVASTSRAIFGETAPSNTPRLQAPHSPRSLLSVQPMPTLSEISTQTEVEVPEIVVVSPSESSASIKENNIDD